MPEPTTTNRDTGKAWLEAHARTTSPGRSAGAKPRPALRRPAKSKAELQRERDRHLYMLRLDGYTYREIAARANLTHSAVLYAIRRIPDSVKLAIESRVLGTG